MFSRRGYQVVDFEQPADIYIINTCTVTHVGDRKSRQLVRRAAKNNPEAFIVVAGCYAQVSPGEAQAIPGVDLVVGTQNKGQIIDLIEAAAGRKGLFNAVEDISRSVAYEELPAPVMTERVRAFLKIQEGCSNFCTYCIIPYARGPFKSRKPENILAEAGHLLSEGFKEIVVTGINTGAYGCDLKDGTDLAELLNLLVQLPGLVRLRLSSVEPQEITDALVEAIAVNKKICRHLHIPLQSGDDAILKKMNRKYTAGYFRELTRALRRESTDVAITTDVMAGFPGETEEQFLNTYSFVKEIAFSRLHVFKYSPRRGTRAAEWPEQVPATVKEKRSAQLISLGEELARSFASRFLDRTVEVLAEEPSKKFPGFFEGLTSNYLRTIFPFVSGIRGELVKVKVEKLIGPDLNGKII